MPAAARPILALEALGRTFETLTATARWSLRRPFEGAELSRQMVRFGVNSIPVVCVTALFVGMVMGLETYRGFARFRAGAFTGGVVALAILREVGPVFTALMVTGRVGSAYAAELASMRTSEQIDALVAMGTEPVQYLLVPRILAGFLMLPLLQVLAIAVGVLGGRLIAVGVLGANPVEYDTSTFHLLQRSDFISSLVKTAVFGALLSLVSCTQGFHARRGAEAVGEATTRAVVNSSLTIVIADFVLSMLFY
jgi:phospholipid/cholesterol/gamma-HCH transport system permease protein